ncbi:MAG: hypothetical protein JSU59_10755 [Nitrospirota bacterium]|nr:MAG: hypothetical protein JSU59_10755 [Nitrospirota bacterium]
MERIPFYRTRHGGTFISGLIPGLGLWFRGYPNQGLVTFCIGSILGTAIWGVGLWGGPGASIFFAMLFVLPWWVFQIFQTSLPSPTGMKDTWNIVWEKGHDIQYLGGLFFLAAIMDTYIILANPQYSLHVFCTRPTGVLGAIAKIQSPTFHVAIGYGFLGRRRWALLVYLVYAGYGLMNATANFACEGYGRIRTVFFFTLLAFTIYVLIRRQCFSSNSARS